MRLVSIIIPIYNLKQYLYYSIESALNQTHKNIEIILVDDGSTDGSGDLCDTYERKYPNIRVIHKKNAGVSAARNTGLDNMTGDFAMFLDGDDIIASNSIEVLLNDYDSTPNCVYAGFSYCKITQYDYQFASKLSKNKVIKHTDLLYGLLTQEYENIGAVEKIYPYRLIKNARFVEGRGANEDKFFLFQYLMNNSGNVSERNDKLYGYYIRMGSATQSKYSNKSLDTLYFSKRILKSVSEMTPKLIEVAEYNDIVTRLAVLKMIVRSKMYKQEHHTFTGIKTELIKKYKNKNIKFFRKYKYEIMALKISDYLYILCVYLFDFIKRRKHE